MYATNASRRMTRIIWAVKLGTFVNVCTPRALCRRACPDATHRRRVLPVSVSTEHCSEIDLARSTQRRRSRRPGPCARRSCRKAYARFRRLTVRHRQILEGDTSTRNEQLGSSAKYRSGGLAGCGRPQRLPRRRPNGRSDTARVTRRGAYTASYVVRRRPPNPSARMPNPSVTIVTVTGVSLAPVAASRVNRVRAVRRLVRRRVVATLRRWMAVFECRCAARIVARFFAADRIRAARQPR